MNNSKEISNNKDNNKMKSYEGFQNDFIFNKNEENILFSQENHHNPLKVPVDSEVFTSIIDGKQKKFMNMKVFQEFSFEHLPRVI